MPSRYRAPRPIRRRRLFLFSLKVMPRARDSTPAKAADATSSLAAGSAGHMGLHAFLHLFHRDIFFVRGQMPDMSERIDHGADSIAVKLVRQSFLYRRTRCDRLIEN